MGLNGWSVGAGGLGFKGCWVWMIGVDWWWPTGARG